MKAASSAKGPGGIRLHRFGSGPIAAHNPSAWRVTSARSKSTSRPGIRRVLGCKQGSAGGVVRGIGAAYKTARVAGEGMYMPGFRRTALIAISMLMVTMTAQAAGKTLDIEAHRGGRALKPENTLQSF